jgi:O-antigen/teichoic acid export membrane protein
MAYDRSRPIPWRRLLREATIFMVVGAVAIAFVFKDSTPATYVGLVLGMAMYVLFLAVLSKFGYQRQSFRQLREQGRNAPRKAPAALVESGRARPAPTRRTTTGPSQRPTRSTKKRRR